MATQSDLLKRFISYAKVDSRSEMGSDKTPSTYGQTKMIMLIMRELLAAGIDRDQMINLSDGSLLVHFAGTGEGKTVCLAAHVDTYFGLPGGARPIVHNYKGGEINLSENKVVIREQDLAGKEGKTVVTADGNTTLGADDKSGVAILVQLAIDILKGEISHGPLYLWFCTDEEVDKEYNGILPADIVDSWDMMITVDGDDPDKISIGCFSCCKTVVEFIGEDAHPGDGGHNIRPANYAAHRLICDLEDQYPAPWNSIGDNGFIYAVEFKEKGPSRALVVFLPRAFDRIELGDYYIAIALAAQKVAERYCVDYKISGKLIYKNIAIAIKINLNMIKPIREDIVGVGLKQARFVNSRYGTDGAMINMLYSWLPAPNIGTGGYNAHGYNEFLVVEEMYSVYKALKVLLPLYMDK